MPHAGPGQMVVKIDYCGVCGTDMEAYRYEIVKPVIVLGHENVGTVYQVGEGVTRFRVGDKVLCGPPSYCKESCSACRSGRPNICAHGFGRTNGIGGPDGGFAEYMLVGDVEHTMIVPIPEGVDPKDAVLFDVICVSLHALRRSNFKFGDTVAVSGTGPIGLAAIQLFTTPILGLFNASDELLRIGVPALRTISLCFVFAGFNVICGSAFQALGHGVLSMIISIVRQLVVLLPAAFLLSLSGVLDAVWWAFPIAELAAVVLSALFLRRTYLATVAPLGDGEG